MTGKPVQGVTTVYVYDGRVIAHESDFARDCPGGFTLLEAQTRRARAALARGVVQALASPALYENLDTYDFEQILRKMKGQVQVLPVGHPEPPLR